MAEEKEKRSSKRYGKSPKIEEKAAKRSDGPMDGEVEVRHEKPVTETKGKPKADVMSGTDDIPVPEDKYEQPKGEEARPVDGVGGMSMRHATERHDMHMRHSRERDEMHMRHERDHHGA